MTIWLKLHIIIYVKLKDFSCCWVEECGFKVFFTSSLFYTMHKQSIHIEPLIYCYWWKCVSIGVVTEFFADILGGLENKIKPKVCLWFPRKLTSGKAKEHFYTVASTTRPGSPCNVSGCIDIKYHVHAQQSTWDNFRIKTCSCIYSTGSNLSFMLDGCSIYSCEGSCSDIGSVSFWARIDSLMPQEPRTKVIKAY